MRLLMRTFPVTLAIGLATIAGCIPPGGMRGGALSGAASGAGQTGVLVRPGGGPAPSSPNATMPASLPPPAAPTTLAQRNVMFNTGSTLTGVGAGLVIGGAVFTVVGAVVPCKDSGCKSASEAKSDKALGDVFIGVGAAAFVVGGVALAIGIPVWIAGYGQISRQVEAGGGSAWFVAPDGVGVHF